jgi:hypothetical protein
MSPRRRPWRRHDAPRLGHCWAGGKAAYPARGGATAAARALPGNLTAYQCPRCGHWHLTKTPRK